ncbi:MAG: hypothetical protein ACOCTN_02775 [Candidatus Natronoplasma sp.]
MTEESLRGIISRYFEYSVLISIIIILSLAPVSASFSENVKSEETHSERLYSLKAPENLEVEHSDPIGELVENGNFSEDYEPWDLTEEQSGGKAGWDDKSNSADGSGSIHIQATQEGQGTTTEEAYWQQDIPATEGAITFSGAFNKNITLQPGGNLNHSMVEIQVADTEDGWQTIYEDTDNSGQDPEWIDFGPNEYEPNGKVTSVRVYMLLEVEGSVNPHPDSGDIWVDDISMVSDSSDGNDHNLLTWDTSPDDPENVTHYNVYRSERRGSGYEIISNESADGSETYQYMDEGKGRADDTIWWYKVEAANQSEDPAETDPVQEPGPQPPTDPNPEDGADGVSTYPELSVSISHIEGNNVDSVTFYDASDNTEIGSKDDVGDGSRTEDVIWDGLEAGEEYNWYTVAEEDGIGSVKSDTWSFTTNPDGVAVETLEAKNVTTDSARLRGNVTSLGVYDQVEVYFRWRQEGDIEWNETDVQTISAAEESDEVIDGLDDEMKYEFKAVMEQDHMEEFGDLREFTTRREAFFEIEIVDYDRQVVEGEELVVNYTVENIGDVRGTQDIHFTVYDNASDEVYSDVMKSLELNGDEIYEKGNFSWMPEDAGEYSFKIASDSDHHPGDDVSVEGAALPDGQSFDDWWSYLILGLAALVIIAGGLLYKNKSAKEEPVIEEIFLISERNSMLILHNTRRLKPDRDSDIIAGMFESVQKFIEDSFQDAEDWTLNKMEFGDNKVVVERGEHVYMAVVYKGELSEKKVQEIRDVITKIEEEFGVQLEEWDGDRKEIQGIDNIIEELFS